MPALQAAVASGAAVVFCSSKTAAEIESLLSRMSLSLPFVSENGGGLHIPAGYPHVEPKELPLEGGWRVVSLGAPYPELVRALRETRTRLGLEMRGFSDMPAEEIAELCGLSLADAALAKQRRFDEPFVIGAEDEAAAGRVREAFEARGLRVTRGGRFFHLTGDSDKGVAVVRMNGFLSAERPGVLTLGLGDSANDLPMLAVVDLPMLVQRPDGTHDEAVTAHLPQVLRIPGIGPVGWYMAVMHFLREDPCEW